MFQDVLSCSQFVDFFWNEVPSGALVLTLISASFVLLTVLLTFCFGEAESILSNVTFKALL